MSAPRPSCGLTILRTVGNYRATKRWTFDPIQKEWKKAKYETGAWFVPSEHSFGNLAELVSLIDEARKDPRAFAVQGSLHEHVRDQLAANPGQLIRRRKLKRGNVEPTIGDRPRSWVPIDIDNWPLPSWGDLVDDPEAVIEHAIHELLPAAFHDLTCWWQLSSSAGFAAGILKVHLFYWLTEPVTNEHLKKVFRRHAPSIDRALFDAVQELYIADPIIEGGPDPIPRRMGWLTGLEQAVALPALPPVVYRPRAPSTGRGDVLDALSVLGDGDGVDGFHAPLRTATLRYARRCNRHNERDDDAVKAQLLEAIAAAPQRSDRNVSADYGDAYLQKMIEGAFRYLSAEPDIQTMRPHHQAPTNTVAEAQAAVAEHVAGSMTRALDWHRLDKATRAITPPEHAGIIVGVGVGKSSKAREAIPAYIDAAKAEKLPHRVLWLVPTHSLSAEALTAMDGLNLNVAVMRGRDAEVPGTGNAREGIPPTKMCLNYEAVQDAVKIGAEVEGTVCGTGKVGEESCIFHGVCAYQRQKKRVATADVVIAAHQALFHQLAKEVSRGLGLVIVDEAWWQAGIEPGRWTRIAGFAEAPINYPVLEKTRVSKLSLTRVWRPKQHDTDTNDLHVLSARAESVFVATANGELVSKERAMAAGLTAEDCATAAKLEWRRKVEGTLWPGQSKQQREAGVEAAAGNAAIGRRVGIWKALEELLSGDASHTGRLQVATKKDEKGTERVVLLHTRLDVRETISGLPMLLLDATMPETIVRYFLPRLDVLAEVQAAAPHMRIHQLLGGWGKTSLVENDRASPEENSRRRNIVAELADFVLLNSGGNALAVTYKAIEHSFKAPGVAIGHFNNMAGIDAHKDVRAIFVIGRPFPDASDLREQAMALTGRPIVPENGQVETRGALMADGTGTAINVRVYADPDMEALRTAITDREVIQVIGRGRAVWRDKDSPLDVFVFADVVLPLPVTRVAKWEDIRLGVVDRMLARKAALLSPADAAKAYPDIFPTTDAARMAIKRERDPAPFPEHSPKSNTLLGVCSGNTPLEVSYRPHGRGQNQRTAYVFEHHADTLEAWLIATIAPLAHYEIVDQPVTTSAPDEGYLPALAYPVMNPDSPLQIVTDLFRMSYRKRPANDFGRNFPRGDPNLGARLPANSNGADRAENAI